MKNWGSIILNLVIVGVITLTIAFSWYYSEASTPGPLTEDTLVYISSGSSVHSITQKLFQEGAVENTLVFNIAARIANHAQHLKAGEYNIKAESSIKQIITQLQNGLTYQHQVTIPEGLMSVEIIDLLNKNEVLEGEITSIPPEGSLLPETYSFSRGDTRQSIVERMVRDMQITIDALWNERQDSLPIKTKEEAIILASIVEKETSVPEERPRVAGVFTNRLNIRMPLQTDPTVIYAITEGKYVLDRPLTYKDLKTASPYNTYVVQGLPPGPIANPGKESIKAVLHPEPNEYFYFVADGTGGHAFAKNLKGHNRNVAKWRKIQKAQN